MDDFYLKHLQNEYMAVDICLLKPKNADGSRPGGSLKVGTAKLPLHRLLEKEHSF